MAARLGAHSGRLAHRVTATQILRSGLVPLQRLTAAPEGLRTARKGRRGCGSCQYAAVVRPAFRPSPPKRAVAVQQAVKAVICRCASSEPTTAGCRQQPGSKRNRVERACERRGQWIDMCGVGVTSAAEPESNGATTSSATEWPTFALPPLRVPPSPSPSGPVRFATNL